MKHRILSALMALACARALSASAVFASVSTNDTPLASGQAGRTVPAKTASDPSEDDGDEDSDEDGDEDDGDEDSDEDAGELGEHERKQNHGWFVSQVAHDHSLTGRDHGKAVSEAAHGSDGKKAKPTH
jgi:cobalamin biosynthesis protein CobT